MSRYRGFGAPQGAAVVTEEDLDTGWASWTTPPVVTVEQGWATPGPAVQRIPEEGPGILDTIFGTVDKVLDRTGRVVDIFGRQVSPPPPAQPQKESVPIWVYLAIPVALIAVVALMRRKPSGGLSGYKRRRRSRRSRR